MWRFGFKNPIEFSDDRVDCGGFTRQWRENQGRCGVCGDPWDLPRPRPHETRGRYGRGTIVRTYKQGQVVEFVSELLDGGKGWLEYRVCPRASVWTAENPSCFNYTLQDIHGRKQLPVNITGKLSRITHAFRLPPHLSCLACVIQWRYVKMGRPERTDYRACADVTIIPTNNSQDGRAHPDTVNNTITAPSRVDSAPATQNMTAGSTTSMEITSQGTEKNACTYPQLSSEPVCTNWAPSSASPVDEGSREGDQDGGGSYLSFSLLGSAVVMVSVLLSAVVV